MSYMKNLKSELREKVLSERATITAEERRAMSNAICKRAEALSAFRLAETILLYAPKEIEVDVMPIAHAAWNAGKAVAFPKCRRSPDGIAYMTYHIVNSEEELLPGTFGIMEPADTSPLYDPKTDPRASLAFAPALAFDEKGYRLGYGGGYYDRYFNSYGGSVVGVIYSKFVYPSLPHGRYDIRTGLIITEKGVKVTVED